ncbi:glycosyltransferase family 4 protein [uncultured Tateyamaria sp.]|uniref:glycosyltransferase family 4 protein n=1 Tax=uncultured Tateyamaria sp. TaxID=455651 RepID=UPI002631C2EC|nr:glycosyltransferase family 4 protein [uncultured Tateyamaria sp.]
MSDLPRVAYLTSLYPAASHTFILREVTALRDLGFEVVTCSVRRPGPTHLIGPEEEAAHDSTFYVIEAGKNPVRMLQAIAGGLASPARFLKALKLARRTAPPGLKGALKQLAYFAEGLVLSRHLHAQGVQHLHTHFADPPAHVAMLTAALSGIPFSYTLHGPAEIYEPNTWCLREKTAEATFVACISHFCRSQAMYFSDPAHWDKLHIIHCGVIPERYESDPPKSKAPGTNLVFVGRLTPIKGLRVLIEAFAAAHATRPDLTLTLVGDGDDRAHLEAMAAPLGDAVQFLGFQSQQGVADALAAADALVLPSFAEGLPVVLMEALAAGKPVICTQLAGVGELVEDGVSGFIVPASDAEALTARIHDMAEDPARRAEMGARGREKVRAEFDVRHEAARIGALFAGTHDGKIRPDPLKRPS